MTICQITGMACDCQPDDGVPCTGEKTLKQGFHGWRNAALKGATRIAELEAENVGLKLALNASPGLTPCRFALEKLQAQVAALTKRAEAAETSAITMASKAWAPLLKASIDMLCAIDERHDTQEAPPKYKIPYGAVNAVRAALGSVGAALASTDQETKT